MIRNNMIEVQYRAVQYSTEQYSTVQYSTVQNSTVQYSTVQYSILLCTFVEITFLSNQIWFAFISSTISQGIEEMRVVRLPYAGLAPSDTNTTDFEYRSKTDLTLHTSACMQVSTSIYSYIYNFCYYFI